DDDRGRDGGLGGGELELLPRHGDGRGLRGRGLGRNRSDRDGESHQRDPERERDAVHEAPLRSKFLRGHRNRACVKARLRLSVEELGFQLLALYIVTVTLLPALLERDRELVDTSALDLEDVEAHPVMRDVIAYLGLSTEHA